MVKNNKGHKCKVIIFYKNVLIKRHEILKCFKIKLLYCILCFQAVQLNIIQLISDIL